MFIDPATFGSEFARDFIYSSNYFIQSIYFQTTLRTATSLLDSISTNLSHLNRFAFFYLAETNRLANGKNIDLYKSQFRPLRKGISSMLRLHATGAVAMPIEIRLQVLASSRDVIHS